MQLDLNALESDREFVKRELARRKHLNFIKYVWQNSTENFIVGLHTTEICKQIDIAMNDLACGKSTFLIIKVPFRHGKSEIISRKLPPHFLGVFPDKKVIMVGHTTDLMLGYSKQARDIMATTEYHELYDVSVNPSSSAVDHWRVKDREGECYASGLLTGLSGQGYELGILDDYCRNRADAESETMREKSWEAFTNDFLTRRAPVSITIILATPWHTDDIIGRIEKRIDPNNDFYDKDFPRFKVISFPAINGDVVVNGKELKYDYLFPERFSQDWYKQQFASLGEYAASALLQCNPQIRGGNLIDTSKIKLHNTIGDFPIMKYYRVWDLAHSERQRMKDDPDWTSGTLLGYRKVNGVWELWIKDVARIRGKAPERDLFIETVAEKDGQGVTIAVEASIDSRDALATMQTIFNGRRIVRGIQTKGDKVARISYVEPIFEAGNVHILCGEWNFDWLSEVKEFPSGKHDDQVDNLSAGYELCCQNVGVIMQSKVLGV